MDADGDLVLPGGIDTHVHIREPEMCQRGTFQSETAAAAAGGITTIFEMPISALPVLSGNTSEANRYSLRSILYRFCFYGAAGGRANISRLLRRPVLSVSNIPFSLPCQDGSGVQRTCMDDDGALWQGMRAVAETGLPLPFMLKMMLLSSDVQLHFVTGKKRFCRSWPIPSAPCGSSGSRKNHPLCFLAQYSSELLPRFVSRSLFDDQEGQGKRAAHLC